VTDYGHELLFGTVLVPRADRPGAVIELAESAERAGLDLVSVPDHPYHPEFLDAWTVLSAIAARTTRVRVFPNVANLPLRPPAILARSTASLDLLSGGRAELGLGAGAYWDAIAAQGGPWRTPAESVAALEEAIRVVRTLWTPGHAARVDGKYYGLYGTSPGPFPAHPVGLWIGALGPRMLRLTGTSADGWLPSMPRVPPEELAAANGIIDEAAAEAGRSPQDVRRLYNLSGSVSSRPAAWAEQLAELALTHGMSAFILPADSAAEIQRFAAEVVPLVRELVAAERAGSRPPARTGEPLTAIPTPDDGIRLSDVRIWDEDSRPTGPAAESGRRYGPEEQVAGQRLIEVHDYLRTELEMLRELMRQVVAGTLGAGAARSQLHTMALRQNNWTLDAFCASYCRAVTMHHAREDVDIFPGLRRFEPGLTGVLDRLEAEHRTIHEVVESVDQALIAFVAHPEAGADLRTAVDLLSDTLLSHLSYEERELTEPLARFWGSNGLRFSY
jgi:alkanesulfonate monooxygenase SsuD/methylene tetrahydromethanopterin reductase-like flavin-dependent oxidoreductase (luciferase family)/hemerythrin-like domain-containing protein